MMNEMYFENKKLSKCYYQMRVALVFCLYSTTKTVAIYNTKKYKKL